jgi:hypothetical protein
MLCGCYEVVIAMQYQVILNRDCFLLEQSSKSESIKLFFHEQRFFW